MNAPTVDDIDNLQLALREARALADMLDSVSTAEEDTPMDTIGQVGRMIRDRLDVARAVADRVTT